MGLFDKRDRRKRVSRNEFDSPVEQIDLSTASGPIAVPQIEPETQPGQAEPQVLQVPENVPEGAPGGSSGGASETRSSAEAGDSSTAEQAAPAAEIPAEPAAPAAPALAYGIDNAIELMRTLPNDNIELVVKVVKHTLESLRISTADIIQDAVAKQERIEARLKKLRSEIGEYEKEIATRQKEIETLGGEYKETNTVRKHLELAENLCKNGNGKRASQGRAGSPPAGAPRPQSSPKRPDKPVNRASNSSLPAHHGPAKK